MLGLFLTIRNIVQGMSPFSADYSLYLFLTMQLTAWDLMTAILIFSGDNAFHNGKQKATSIQCVQHEPKFLYVLDVNNFSKIAVFPLNCSSGFAQLVLIEML